MTALHRGVGTINPGIRALPASGPATRVDASAHRLQWNENPFDYPPDLKEEVLQRLASAQWSRYPLGLRAYDLMEKLAAHWSVTPDHVVVGHGSSDVIRLVCAAVLQAGDHVVMPSPTFLLYKRNARILDAVVHEVALSPDDDFALPVDDLVACARTHAAKLVVICAPNNPTGTIYAQADLRRVVEESGALVLIDEAYAEFCGQNLRPLLDEYDNLVLVRTFSKAYSMAGVRVGYGLAAPELAAELQKLVNVFTLSPFSETTAIVALEHHARFMANVQAVVAERMRMAHALDELPGVRVFPSGANFLLVRPEQPAGEIHDYLLRQHHLLISDMSMNPELRNHLRISVGTAEQNDLLLAAFAEFVNDRE